MGAEPVGEWVRLRLKRKGFVVGGGGVVEVEEGVGMGAEAMVTAALVWDCRQFATDISWLLCNIGIRSG